MTMIRRSNVTLSKRSGRSLVRIGGSRKDALEREGGLNRKHPKVDVTDRSVDELIHFR